MHVAAALCIAVALAGDFAPHPNAEALDTKEVVSTGVSGIAVERAMALGITPEVLAGDGAVAAQAIEVLVSLAAQDWSAISTLNAELEADVDALTAARDAYMKSRAPEDAQAIIRLEGEVAASQAAISAALEQHRSAALAQLGDGAASRVARASEGARAGLSPALCVLDHSSEDLQRVLLAQIAERRAARLEEPVPQWATEVLSACRSQPAAIAAQAAIDTHLASIRDVFAVR